MIQPKKGLITFILMAIVIVFGFLGKETESKTLTFGYALNFLSHEWYQNVSRGAAIRAKELGVKLMMADANLEVTNQLHAAESFITQQVDVLILSPVDPQALASLVQKSKAAGIPIITESSIVEGAATHVGIDDKAGGRKAGKWFAEYAKANNIVPKILIVGMPWLPACRWRVEGFKEGLQQSGYTYEIVQEVDGAGLKEQAFTVALDALKAHPEVNVIYGINDDSAIAGMSAYKAAGLDQSTLTVIGFGFEGKAGQNALLGDTPYKASVAMFPNFVGMSLIDAAVAIANGEKLPTFFETPTIVIDKSNFDQFYKKKDTHYIIDLEAVRSLMK